VGHGGVTPHAKPWTFLTNHARVLIVIARNPHTRLRDIADTIGITERAAQAIVTDLEEGGYITRTKVGRRNHYSVDPTRPFRHPADADHRIEGLLTLFSDHDNDHEPDSGARAQGDGGSSGKVIS
jgi:MarR family